MKIFNTVAFLAIANLVAPASAQTSYSYTEDTSISMFGGNGIAATDFTHLSSIQVPNSKDLLIGLSADIYLMTFTEAAGTNKDTSMASANVCGCVRVVDNDTFEAHGSSALAVCEDALGEVAKPGMVTFSSRKQTLSSLTDLDITSRAGLCDDCEIAGQVTVDLKLETVAAHHFNFVAQLDGTTFSAKNPARIIACWDGSGDTDVDDGKADTAIGLGKTMLTATEVLSFSSSKKLF